MEPYDAFAALWAELAIESRSDPWPLGTEDAGLDDDMALDRRPSSAAEALHRREQRVEARLLDFGDLGVRAIDQTLPCWMGCLSTTTLIRHSQGSHTRVFHDAIAEVLHARLVSSAVTAARRLEGGRLRFAEAKRREREPLEIVYRRLLDACGGEVRERLQQRQANYLSLLAAAAGGGTAPPPVPATLRRTVVVHGTWAAGADWWRDPSGLGTPPAPDSLWQHLYNQGVVGLVGAPDEFAWSGGNSDHDRRQGAADFVNWWRGLGEPLLDVVAHSHGGNVAMLASAIEPTLKLRRLVLLGTPSRFDYVPRIGQLEHLHNVYSEHDLVQIPGSWGARRGEGRTQSDHAQGTNRHVPYWDPKVLGVQPVDHGGLHHPDVWANHGLVATLT